MVVAFFSWWYGSGWQQEASAISRTVARITDTFSIGLLLTSLFAPFRQISAGRVQGPLGVQLQAWVDRLVSRCIGAMVRSAMIVTGIVMISFVALFGGIRLIVWPLLPIVPLIGVVLMMSGWVPWQS